MGLLSAIKSGIKAIAKRISSAVTRSSGATRSAKPNSIFSSGSRSTATRASASAGGGFWSGIWNGIKSAGKAIGKAVSSACKALKPAGKAIVKYGSKALRVAKPLFKKIPIIGIALTAIIDGPEIYNAFTKGGSKEGQKEVIGFSKELGSTLAGAGVGAAIGSIVPGLGTAIGGLIGGIIGGIGGMIWRGKTYSEREEAGLVAHAKETDKKPPVSNEKPQKPSFDNDNIADIDAPAQNVGSYNFNQYKRLKSLGLSNMDILRCQALGYGYDDVLEKIQEHPHNPSLRFNNANRERHLVA